MQTGTDAVLSSLLVDGEWNFNNDSNIGYLENLGSVSANPSMSTLVLSVCWHTQTQ